MRKNSWGALHRFQWWANQRRVQDTSRATVAWWFGANWNAHHKHNMHLSVRSSGCLVIQTSHMRGCVGSGGVARSFMRTKVNSATRPSVQKCANRWWSGDLSALFKQPGCRTKMQNQKVMSIKHHPSTFCRPPRCEKDVNTRAREALQRVHLQCVTFCKIMA